MNGHYPILPDDYENAKRTKPSEFAKHFNGRRFLTRQRHACVGCGPAIEVYGYGLEHICWADDCETANMIADALELSADATTERNEGE